MKNKDEIYDDYDDETTSQRHGNSKYLSDEDRQAAIMERRKQYYANSVLAKKLKSNLEIMQYYFDRFGNSVLIDSQELENAGFAWDAITGTLLHEGYEYRSVGSYRYIIFENNKTQILKL